MVVDDIRPITDVSMVVGGAMIQVGRGFDPALLRAVVFPSSVTVHTSAHDHHPPDADPTR